MLKRMTKITSLLVCAASIVSIVPVSAADIKSYESQEGTVYNAKAKGAGIYIDGEINDKDEAQYFVTPDGKYNVLDGLDAGASVDDLLLNQYLVIDEDTVVDIKDNYKVIDENTREDLQDDVASTLRKKIKNDNDNRFSDSENQKAGTKFLAGGSGLSMYKYTLETVGTGKTEDAIYADYAGNYVDADYNLGSIKITTTAGSVTLKNTDDTYQVTKDNVTYEYKAELQEDADSDSASKYVTDIGDSVYRFAFLTIYERSKTGSGSWSDWDAVTDQVGIGGKKYKATDITDDNSVMVLHKFSKTAASDDVDGIKYSKDSTIYFIQDEDGKSEKILGMSAAKAKAKLGKSSSAKGSVKITGNDKALCSAFLDTTNSNDMTIYAETLTLKSVSGFNYVDIGDYDSTSSDIASISNTGGYIYVLDGGYVKAWDGDESFTKVYKVDGSMDNMSIGSKDFMILWNEDDEVYTIINNPKAAATTTTETTAATTAGTTTATTTAAVGWVKATDGTWSYNKADGSKATGWLKDGGNWYFLKADGAMVTGWYNDNGTWYYLDGSGAMLYNTTVDGYVLGASGAWIK